MGNYTQLEFSGTVKKEYSEAIDKLMTYVYPEYFSEGAESMPWKSTGVDFMMEFANVSRATFIPYGADKNNREWNKETGKWFFITALKNYAGTYEAFFEIVPLFMETVEKCITTDDVVREHALIDGKINCTKIDKNAKPYF